MRKLPASAALLVLAALGTTALTTTVFVHFARAPRAAQQLPPPLEPDLAHALAVVSAPDGLHVLYPDEAYLIDGDLTWSRVTWRNARTAQQGLRSLGFAVDTPPNAPLPWVFLAREGQLEPLEIDRDRQTGTTTHAGALHLSLRNLDGQLSARAHGEWRGAATVRVGNDFVAHPLGDGWLAINHHGAAQAIRLDAHGRRLHPTTLFASVGILSHTPPAIWLAVLATLYGLSLLTIWNLRRAMRPTANLRFGTLRLPPGAVVFGDHRRGALLPEGAAVLVDGAHLELGPGLERSDREPSFPLVDGEDVYVVGRVTGEPCAGPWRSSHRQRLEPDGKHYQLGRGTPADHLRHRVTQLKVAAFVHLAFGAALLGALALRTPA